MGLAAISLLGVLWLNLLPAFLSFCTAFLLARWLGQEGRWGSKLSSGLTRRLAATLVGLLPLLLLAAVLTFAGNKLGGLQSELAGLSAKMVEFLESWRKSLPAMLIDFLPPAGELHAYFGEFLKERVGLVASAGKTWLVGSLQVIVGAIVGVMLVLHQAEAKSLLGRAIAQRAQLFVGTFGAVVTAQFFIAGVNTAATALYLFVALPLFDITMPYAYGLVALTFIGGLIPIVGNLLCNVVLTLVALSVGPGVAVASLLMLIVVHKSEYFINAAVVGTKTNISIWELLVAIFVGEAMFGVAGLVAAPLYYAYLKQELALTPLGRPALH